MQPTRVAGKPSAGSRLVDGLVIVVMPIAVAVVVAAVAAGERSGPDAEVQLFAPTSALPGSDVPVRAIFMAHPDAPEGPELRMARVTVSLRDARGARHAVISLRETPAVSMEGALHLPAGLRGRLTLEADARGRGDLRVRARAGLDVRDDATPRPRAERRLPPLASLFVGPPRPAGPDAGPRDAPPDLEVRVVGGACVPEGSCAVLVRRAAPCAVRVMQNAALEVHERTPPPEAAGVQVLRLTVHGPEASGELSIVRGGVEVARRDLRLPVALGEPALYAIEGDRFFVHTEERNRGVVFDLFDARGFWTATASMAAEAATHPQPAPFRLAPGTRVHVQARTDPYGSDSAAVRVLDVPARLPEHDPDGAWDRAELERYRYSTPRGVTGRHDDDARIAAARERLRWLAMLTILGAAIAVAAWLTARGLRASAEARALAAEAGDEHAEDPRARNRDRLVVLAVVCVVLVAFVAIFAGVVARSALP